MSKNKHFGLPTKTDRGDYEKYLMGQVKITDLIIKRKKTNSYFNRIFNFLLNEKLQPYQKFKPTSNENTTQQPARVG